MVRVKYRYLVMKYGFDEGRKYKISPLTLSDIVKELVFTDHGEWGLARLDVLVIENFPASCIFLFRVPRGALEIVRASLEECTNLGGSACKLDIVFVSGCVKSAKKKALTYMAA